MGWSTKQKAHPTVDKSSEILRSAPTYLEAATSINNENPQNGHGKPTQRKPPHWARQPRRARANASKKPKRAPREGAGTQSREKERQKSIERAGT